MMLHPEKRSARDRRRGERRLIGGFIARDQRSKSLIQ
jgi:hypothetical protein